MLANGRSLVRRAGWAGAVLTSLLAGGLAFSAGENASAPAKKAPVVKGPVAKVTPQEEYAIGREMFLREWVANDSRAHGGDGLGPVFNDSSCIACHNLGGVGGGGPLNKNVDIVSAFHSPAMSGADDEFAPAQRPSSSRVTDVVDIRTRRKVSNNEEQKEADQAAALKAQLKLDTEKLALAHPGFKTSRSVVLHRFGTKVEYDEWKGDLLSSGRSVGGVTSLDEFSLPSPVANDDPSSDKVEIVRNTKQARAQVRAKRPALSPVDKLRLQARSAGLGRPGNGMSARSGNFALLLSQRNTTALFGVGLIDSIPDKAIEEAAATKHNDFPSVRGRVARLADGKIGRFGWKAQKATLREFAMTACAVELGLNVPEQQQAGLAYDPEYKSPGLDMNLKECDGLVTFLKKLPAPAELKAPTEKEAKYLHGGQELFAKVGCAACHTQKLGEVAGIFSDLLVHDMGPELGDTGSYGVFVPSSATDDISEPPPELTANEAVPQALGIQAANGKPATPKKIVGAMRQEWRTAPLWGVRDSAPYLHDGRAETLEEAIALHGGEADPSSKKFFELSREQRMQVVAFLKSLVAPEQVATR